MAIVPSLHLRKNFSQVLSEVLQLDLEMFPEERSTMVKMPKLHLEDHVDLSGALTRLGETPRQGVGGMQHPHTRPSFFVLLLLRTVSILPVHPGPPPHSKHSTQKKMNRQALQVKPHLGLSSLEKLQEAGEPLLTGCPAQQQSLRGKTPIQR